MTRKLAHALLVALVVLALAGCGGKTKAAPSTTHAAPVDAAACAQLEGYVRLVSQVISSSVEAMTQSTRPKQLAPGRSQRSGTCTQRRTCSSGPSFRSPSSSRRGSWRAGCALRRRLRPCERLGRPRGSRAAAQQLVDRPALTLVKDATAKIDRACGV